MYVEETADVLANCLDMQTTLRYWTFDAFSLLLQGGPPVAHGQCFAVQLYSVSAGRTHIINLQQNVSREPLAHHVFGIK